MSGPEIVLILSWYAEFMLKILKFYWEKQEQDWNSHDLLETCFKTWREKKYNPEKVGGGKSCFKDCYQSQHKLISADHPWGAFHESGYLRDVIQESCYLRDVIRESCCYLWNAIFQMTNVRLNLIGEGTYELNFMKQILHSLEFLQIS